LYNFKSNDLAARDWAVAAFFAIPPLLWVWRRRRKRGRGFPVMVTEPAETTA
jgi:hypothetical protein